MLTTFDYCYLAGGLVGVIALLIAICDAYRPAVRILVPLALMGAFGVVTYFILGDSPVPPNAVFPLSVPCGR